MYPRAKLPITNPLKFVNGKLVLAIMKNGINGHSTQKTRPRAKLPITESPKVWVSSFPSVDGYGKLVSALWRIGKMSIASQKHVLEQNPQLPTRLKFFTPVFPVSTEVENWVSHYGKWEKWP